jgi:hypothetical protein
MARSPAGCRFLVGPDQRDIAASYYDGMMASEKLPVQVGTIRLTPPCERRGGARLRTHGRRSRGLPRVPDLVPAQLLGCVSTVTDLRCLRWLCGFG